MKSQSYYRLPDSQCDISISDQYLAVNCTGVYVFEQQFSNRNSLGRQDYYLMYLHRGSLNIEINGTNRILQAGEAVIYPAKESYAYEKFDSEELVYFWAHFSGYGVLECLKQFGFAPATVYSPGQSEGISACFQRLFQCFYTRESFYEQEAAARLTDVLVRMARRIGKNRGLILSSVSRIQQSLDYLHRNYGEDIRLEQLAEIEHLSVSRYSAVFKQCMGVPPQTFLISLRIENAADLLRRTDLSVKQVALTVGYADPLYFSSLFKKKMGVAPSRYQEQKQNSPPL